jgi:sugar phosphate isomerase/epimerase
MNERELSRRQALARTGLAAGAVLVVGSIPIAPGASAAPQAEMDRPFRFCLNTATIRGQKLGIVKEVELTAKAGYDGIEPWVDSIEEFVKNGGSTKELRQRISDGGLTVESAIGFPEWLAEDEGRRAKGMERAKREMDLVAQIGGIRFAAPPAGATDLPKIDALKAAERYRILLEAGSQIGVVPQLELWGFSHNLNRLGECVWAAMETGHPKACVLADVFHLYKGGSDFRGVRLLGKDAVQVLHMNDYPADPTREKVDDSYRVFPGDGVAPLTQLLAALHATGGQKLLSLELFNRNYWAQDPLEVARTGLNKMRELVKQI